MRAVNSKAHYLLQGRKQARIQSSLNEHQLFGAARAQNKRANAAAEPRLANKWCWVKCRQEMRGAPDATNVCSACSI